LAGEAAMVIYPRRRIKMGGGMAELQKRGEMHSAGQAEDQEKRAIQSFAGVRIERSYNSPDPIAAKRIELVGHDLRANEQTILYGRSNDGAHPIGRIDVGRHRADNQGRQRAEFVGLNKNTGTRLT
jgi:hypothetical protein